MSHGPRRLRAASPPRRRTIPPHGPLMTSRTGSHHEHHGTRPWRRLSRLLRLERADLLTLLAFALGVGLLSLVVPAAIEALVNTVAFGVLLWPVVVLSLVMLAFLLVGAVLRALQTFVAECLQRRIFVRTADAFASHFARAEMEAFDGRNPTDIVNRFFEVSTVQKSLATLLVDGIGIVMITVVGLVVLAFYHPYLLTFAAVMVVLVAFMLVVLGIGGVRTSIAESYAKFDMAAWLEEIAKCPHTFRFGRDGDPLARLDLQPLRPVTRADHFRHHRHGTRLRRQAFASGRFERQLVEYAEFVERRLHVVEDLDVFPDLRQGGQDERDDQFPGHELAERQLAVDDQPAAEPEQHRAADGLEQKREERLPPDHAEVPLAGRHVGICQAVGTVERQVTATAEPEGVRALCDLLEPGGHVELGVALLDARAHAADADARRQADRSPRAAARAATPPRAAPRRASRVFPGRVRAGSRGRHGRAPRPLRTRPRAG
ncbi:MAG: ABC transporter transmembrane domain-containing protein, partial [Planctomycetia bacterium]